MQNHIQLQVIVQAEAIQVGKLLSISFRIVAVEEFRYDHKSLDAPDGTKTL